jgi:N-acetylglutamate synthase-like GNAT family acetyltransferase
MEIRKATKNDLDILTKIAVDCEIDEEKLQHPGRTIKQIKEYTNPKAFREVLLREIREKSRYFAVAEADGRIIGFGQAIVKKNLGEIGRVCISRTCRKRGVGKRLMMQLIWFLRKNKVRTIESCCYTKNKPSLKMHEKLGFKKEAYKLSLELK